MKMVVPKAAPKSHEMSFRVVTGLRPTHRNESQDVTPAKAGVHVREELDSRFRGNDVTFDGAKRGISLCPRPDRSTKKQGEIPRSARNDRGRWGGGFLICNFCFLLYHVSTRLW
jgi:hypothetical protein